ncbi:MAG TPA: hypothetical protein VGH10_07975 [Actinomycetota bacterium]|jgi:hypothetical protein
MRRRATTGVVLVAGMAAALLLGTTTAASAHVAGKAGPYSFLIGWGQEPAYAGQQNSVQFIVKNASTGRAVTDIGDQISVEVIYGTNKMTLPFEPTFDPDTGLGTPGDFRAWFFPSAPGNYTFHLTGKIGSTNIDQSFTSGPTTFDSVQDPAKLQFPVKAPTTTQLNAKLDATLPRLATSAQVESANDAASSAKTVGIIGIVVGAAGLIVAVVALVRKRG